MKIFTGNNEYEKYFKNFKYVHRIFCSYKVVTIVSYWIFHQYIQRFCNILVFFPCLAPKYSQSCVFVPVSLFLFSKKRNDVQKFRTLLEQFLCLRKHGLIDIGYYLGIHLKIILQRLSITFYFSWILIVNICLSP